MRRLWESVRVRMRRKPAKLSSQLQKHLLQEIEPYATFYERLSGLLQNGWLSPKDTLSLNSEQKRLLKGFEERRTAVFERKKTMVTKEEMLTALMELSIKHRAVNALRVAEKLVAFQKRKNKVGKKVLQERLSVLREELADQQLTRELIEQRVSLSGVAIPFREPFEALMKDFALTVASHKETTLRLLPRFPDDLVWMHASGITEILSELLHNAIFHAPRRSTVTVDGNISFKKNWLRFSVHNVGKPISQKNLKVLGKQPFTTRKDGTGSGLLLVSKLVEVLGGHVKIKSSRIKGTEVTVFLPNKERLFNPKDTI